MGLDLFRGLVINQREAELILIPSWEPLDSNKHQLRSKAVLSCLTHLLAGVSFPLALPVLRDKSLMKPGPFFPELLPPAPSLTRDLPCLPGAQ